MIDPQYDPISFFLSAIAKTVFAHKDEIWGILCVQNRTYYNDVLQ